MAHGRRRGAYALGALLLGLGALAACHGGRPENEAGASTADGGGDSGGPGDDASEGDGGCGPPSGEPEPYVSGASGTATGAALSASICNASASLFQPADSVPSGAYVLFLDSSAVGRVAFQSPAGAHEGLLTGILRVGSPSPGVYASSDSASCGSLTFSYLLTLPPGADCEGGAGPDCPAEGDYGANASTDCLGDAQTVAGSWSVNLTSVVPFDGDAGGSYFVAHGTVTATLADEQGGNDTVTLALDF